MVISIALFLVATACSSQSATNQSATPTSVAESEQQVTEEVDEASVIPITADMTFEEKLPAARTNWANIGPRSYDLIVERTCTGCPPSKTRNTIIDGRLMAARPVGDGDNYTLPETMEDLFDQVQNFVFPDTPDVGQVDFDARTGALVSWTQTFDAATENDDRRMEVVVEQPTEIAPTPHGTAEASVQCPDTDFVIVEGSEFLLSLPSGLAAEEVQGVDSEVGAWGAEGFEVSWDFGWFSNPLDYWEGPIVERIVNYGGIGGRVVVAEPVPGFFDGDHVTAAHFMRISGEPNAWNGLTVYVVYDDPSDAPIAECIIASIDWLAAN